MRNKFLDFPDKNEKNSEQNPTADADTETDRKPDDAVETSAAEQLSEMPCKHDGAAYVSQEILQANRCASDD